MEGPLPLALPAQPPSLSAALAEGRTRVGGQRSSSEGVRVHRQPQGMALVWGLSLGLGTSCPPTRVVVCHSRLGPGDALPILEAMGAGPCILGP